MSKNIIRKVKKECEMTKGKNNDFEVVEGEEIIRIGNRNMVKKERKENLQCK